MKNTKSMRCSPSNLYLMPLVRKNDFIIIQKFAYLNVVSFFITVEDVDGQKWFSRPDDDQYSTNLIEKCVTADQIILPCFQPLAPRYVCDENQLFISSGNFLSLLTSQDDATAHLKEWIIKQAVPRLDLISSRKIDEKHIYLRLIDTRLKFMKLLADNGEDQTENIKQMKKLPLWDLL